MTRMAGAMKTLSGRENILDDKSNKDQALIKLQIAKDNLEGVDEALSNYNRPRVMKALDMVEQVMNELESERTKEIDEPTIEEDVR